MIWINKNKALSFGMQKFLLLLLVALTCVSCDRAEHAYKVSKAEQTQSVTTATADAIISVDSAYERRASNVGVEGQGIVVKILPDDNKGSQHQKFLVKIASGKTLLFAHNIELAPRINDIKVGEKVEFRGEYVYNPKGGVIHWTHHDPQGKHFAGWINHNGKIYQ